MATKIHLHELAQTFTGYSPLKEQQSNFCSKKILTFA